jgi:hypothetical protein
LTYFIYFRLKSLLERDFELSGSTKSLTYKMDARGELLLRGDLIRAIACEALMEYEYPLI